MNVQPNRTLLLIPLVMAALAMPVVAENFSPDEAAVSAVDSHGASPADDFTERVPAGSVAESVLFYLIAFLIAGSAVGCAVSTNIVRMATFLFAALGSVAILYFLLAATFLGAIQLIVYAGGTLIVIIFGVMLTSQSPWTKYLPRNSEIAISAIVCLALFGMLAATLVKGDWATEGELTTNYNVARIGQALLTDYLVAFELASVLLLAVMIGAAYLARPEQRDSD